MDRIFSNDRARQNDWDRRGLPGWTYHNAALLELEKTEVFLNHWQIAGHVNDVSNPGDYLTFDICDERAVIIRGEDGEVRAFHNLCRHRGSRVVAGDKGHCKNALVCPFHGWVYNFDGSLRGAARPKSYAALDRKDFGLRPIEMEVWLGLIFLRFRPGPQGSVAEQMERFEPELSAYRPAEMVPSGHVFQSTLPVNWKSVRDVDNEGYHVPMAHPALQDLYGPTYVDHPYENGISLSQGWFSQQGGRRWSVRNYVKFSCSEPWLPDRLRTVWSYYGLFPNNVIIATPETIQFYQELPLGVEEALVRGMIYRRPSENREQKLARYLSYRIDRETYEEDTQLSIWSNESMKSSAFEGFYLSDLEKGLKSHHDHLRRILPVMSLGEQPAEPDLAAVNDHMRAERSDV